MTRAYPEYREWAGSWLGQVPTRWRTGSLRHFAAFTTGWTPPTGDDASYIGSAPWANISDLTAPWLSETAKHISDEAVEGRHACEPGDLLFSFKLSVGAVARAAIPLHTNEAIATFSPSEDLDLGYAYYALPIFLPMNANTNIYGAPLLNSSLIRSAGLALPPLPEQRAIADYLDRETARIDTLIEEQQRLMEMLRKRRQSTLAEHTGWGAKTPEHWTWQRLSWLFNATASGTTPRPEDIVEPSDSTVPWVTTGELREGRISSTAKAVTMDSIAAYSALRIHPKGSLLMAMYGATIGRLAILDTEAASNQACCALSGPTRATAEFTQYSLVAARPWLLLDASGGGQPNINQEKVRTFRIPVPPPEEQKRITSFLDDQFSKIDTLIAETERFIELSQERRSALITAAVTGQIDVREEVA